MARDVRYLITYDASCSACTAIATAISAESKGRVDPVPLQSSETQGILRSAGRLQGYLAEPALIKVRGSKVNVYTGTAMVARLGRILGPVRGLRVCRLAQGQGINLEVRDGQLRVIAGESRRDFLKATARVMLGVTLAPTLLRTKAISLTSPDGHSVRLKTTPLSPAETQAMFLRNLTSGEGLALLKYFESQGYAVQANKIMALRVTTENAISSDLRLYVGLAGANLPDTILKVSEDAHGRTIGAVTMRQAPASTHLDGYQVVNGTVSRVFSTDTAPRATANSAHPDSWTVQCAACITVATLMIGWGCSWFTDVGCIGVCLPLGPIGVGCAVICIALTNFLCDGGAIQGGGTYAACGAIGWC